MYQLLGHESQESASRCDFFPYNYGHYTSMLTWVETKPRKGQRLMSRTYNPFSRSWPKAKESAFYDLVFLFRNPVTGFAEEQLVNLHTLTSEEVLHIVKHYYVTPQQKETLIGYLSRVPNSVYTVWAQFVVNPGQMYVDVIPFRNPVSEMLVSYPHPNVQIPAPEPIGPSRSPGRPPMDRSTVGLSEVQKKRNSLHDKEALDIAPERRDFYYELQGKFNPDRYTEAQIQGML